MKRAIWWGLVLTACSKATQPDADVSAVVVEDASVDADAADAVDDADAASPSVDVSAGVTVS
jgi:hypothetical protein